MQRARFGQVRWMARAALLLGVVNANQIVGQQATITGRITSESGAPLSAVQVFVDETAIGVLTNAAGEYRLDGVPYGQQVIRAQRLGYQPGRREIAVAIDLIPNVNFTLNSSVLALEQLVVTGTPGGTTRRAVGNVVGRLEASDLVATAPVTNVRSMIGTREPGVAVMGGSGSVGAGSPIRIRGSSSLSLDNSPLIYVDGVRVDGGIRSGQGYAQQSGSRLDDFSPEDIESIEIIKGPSAATLYGTEAANGVIQIITKRGTTQGVAFDLSTRQGVNWFPNPREYFGNKWYRPAGSEELVSTYIYDEWEREQGRPYTELGHNQSYHLGASGGSELIRFAASTDWERERGVWYHTDNSNERFGGRLNIDFVGRDNLDVRVSSAYMQRRHVNPEPTAGTGPMAPLLFATHPLHAPARDGYYSAHPLDVSEIGITTDSHRFVGGITITHTPFEWLTQRLTLGIDKNEEARHTIFPRHPLGASGPLGGLSAGLREQYFDAIAGYTGDYAASATKRWTESIETTTSVGLQYNSVRTSNAGIIGTGFPAPPLTSIGATATQSATGDFIENTTVGTYIEQRIGFRDDLYITGALRADDNSAFGAEYELALYPKLSGTWTFDQPMAALPWLDLVRIRSAFGVAGKQPALFATVRLYNPIPGPGGSAAVSPGEIGNPALKPERSRELEVGADLALFGGVTELGITYYTKRTSDAIVSRTLAPSLGFPGQQWVNTGEISNRGMELSLNTDIIGPGGPVAWDVGVGFSSMRSRLDRLGLGSLTRLNQAVGIWHVEGYPIGSAFEYEILSAEFDGAGGVKNVMCRGQDGEAMPFSDQCALVHKGGPADPTWLLNLDTGVTLFERLRLTATVQGKGGHVGMARQIGPAIQCCPSARVIWAEDDAVLTAIGNMRRDIAGHYDAGFIRLQEIGLNYSIPTEVAEKVGASSASIGVQATNVAQLWRAAWYTQVAEERLTGANKEAFRVHEPDVRGNTNFSTSNFAQQPAKAVMTSIRLTF